VIREPLPEFATARTRDLLREILDTGIKLLRRFDDGE
jgi:hypothetical protein